MKQKDEINEVKIIKKKNCTAIYCQTETHSHEHKFIESIGLRRQQ